MKDRIRAAQVVVPCKKLERTLDFFIERLGFRLEMIFPADAPQTAVIAGYGTVLKLEESANFAPVTLNLIGDFARETEREIVLPDGLRIVLADENAAPELSVLKPEFVVSKLSGAWHAGRAGMQYRDLIPNRLGGHLIASHIRIEEGGAVPDYVHFHKIDFQMIYCLQGSARLVYENQGAPFWMRAGDLVLQPPEIRHRVLECSDGFEVLEITSPAVHPTFAEHLLTLPNELCAPETLFSGQRFRHHQAENAVWKKERVFEICDTGVFEASGGKFNAQVWRGLMRGEISFNPANKFCFFYVVNGVLKLKGNENKDVKLEKDDSFLLPAGRDISLICEKSAEFIQVTV